MAEENSLTSNELYFEKVENEHGLELTLEESLQNNFVNLLQDRYDNAKRSRDLDEKRWMIAYHNYRGLYGQNDDLENQKNQEYLLRSQKPKYSLPSVSWLMLFSEQVNFL